MDAEPSSQVLLEQLRAGESRAADAIFQRFARRLAGLARGRLDQRLRQKVDAEDVVQSVFRSFFERSARGTFDFANWDGVWALLVLLTVRKCGRRAMHFKAEELSGADTGASSSIKNLGRAGRWQRACTGPTRSHR